MLSTSFAPCLSDSSEDNSPAIGGYSQYLADMDEMHNVRNTLYQAREAAMDTADSLVCNFAMVDWANNDIGSIWSIVRDIKIKLAETLALTEWGCVGVYVTLD